MKDVVICGGVIASVLVSSAVFTASPLNIQHYGARAKTGLLVIRIMCLGGATCLLVDCCLREKTL